MCWECLPCRELSRRHALVLQVTDALCTSDSQRALGECGLQGLGRLAVWAVRFGAAVPAAPMQPPSAVIGSELRTPAAALPRTPGAAGSPGGGLLNKRCVRLSHSQPAVTLAF